MSNWEFSGSLPSSMAMVVLSCALLGAAMSAMAGVATPRAEIHISPAGDDGRDGAGPERAVRSFERALALTRAAGAPGRIVVHDGAYEDVAITLGPTDSGLEIIAAPGAHPRLLGGRMLTGWRPDGDGLVAAPAPGTRDRTWDFRALVVGGTLAPRARLPETGWLQHESQFNAGWCGEQEYRGADTPETKNKLIYRAQDKAAWMDGRNAELTILHEWDDSLVGVARHDPATRTLFFTNLAGWPPGAWKQHGYCVWNVREGMTTPGQWYLDRDRELVVYKPRPGEDMAATEVVAPRVGSVVVLHGEAGRPVKDVRLIGLTITGTTPQLASGGWGGGAYPGAVELEYAEQCRVEQCTFIAVGGQAVRSTKGDGNRFVRNTIRESGTGGIYSIDGVAEVVADNTIQGIGRLCHGAIGIRVIGEGYGERQLVSHDNLAEHNLVADCPYVAIEFGGQHNTYRFNRIDRPMQLMYDGAGIYGSGRDNLIAGNLVQSIARGTDRPSGCGGLYNDENGTRTRFVGNWVLDCDRPLMIHRGIEDVMLSNICAGPAAMRLYFIGGKSHRVENTALIAGGQLRFDGDGCDQTTWTSTTAWSVANVYQGKPASVRREDPGIAADVKANTWKAQASAAVALTGLSADPAITGPRPDVMAPIIVLQPRPVRQAVGEVVDFAVLATGSPAPELRWERLVGTTWVPLAALPVAAVGDDGALFRAVASNPYGTATSEAARLTVE